MSRWGTPPDIPSGIALGLALLWLALWASGRGRGLASVSTARFLVAASVLSFALSAGYVEHYLVGGPRIIDATTYYLQARTYAALELGFLPPTPEAAHFGRFLVAMPDGRLSGLFPPGFPALLAVLMKLGAPMWLGPLLAIGSTLGTHWVARACVDDDRVVRLAVCMSVACAALRYHTADTMSHGLAAVLVLACLGCALRPDTLWTRVAGLPLGWLFATRPVTGAVVLTVMLVAAGTLASTTAPRRAWRWRVPWLGTSALGLGLFIWQQRIVSGAWFGSSQYRYYDLADLPQGCFRFGFGAEVGCRAEHGAFVEKYLPDGYGLWEALGTTARRLAQHLLDAGNVELFAVPLLAALLLAQRAPKLRLLTWTALLQVVAYAGFYFDGNYPGGGARMFADVLPLEHILIAWVLVRWGLQGVALPTMLAGFAVHASFDHRKLQESGGGRPMFEARLLARAPERALIYVTTDHGYALGVDPTGTDPRQIVRAKGDALDFAAWQAASFPPAFRYEFDPEAARATPALVPVEPAPHPRFEFENQWPVRDIVTAHVRRAPHSECPGMGLELTPVGERGGIEVSLWVPAPGPYSVRLRTAGGVELRHAGTTVALAKVSSEHAEPCTWRAGNLVAPHAGNLRLWLTAPTRAWLDAAELTPLTPPRP